MAAALALAVFAAGGAFAQDSYWGSPKNTFTADFGPTLVGLFINGLADTAGGDTGLSSSGFGIGLQYERQLFEPLAVAGRFAFLGGGLGLSAEDVVDGVKTKAALGMNFSSFSLEAHARFYPGGNAFFLGGLMGYGFLSSTFSGEVLVQDTEGNREKVGVSFTGSRSYMKLGTRVGWRVSSSSGGFTFEPSVGYNIAIGMGDTLGNALVKDIRKKSPDIEMEDDFASSVDDLFKFLEEIIFIGGPRLTLAFGWRF